MGLAAVILSGTILESNMTNSDPEFNKIIGNRTPYERSVLFIVCVMTRALLYSGVYVYREKRWVPFLVGVLSLISFIQLNRPTLNRQWWSKKFQALMSFLVVLACIAVYFKRVDPKSIPTLLFISLLGGVLQRIHITMN